MNKQMTSEKQNRKMPILSVENLGAAISSPSGLVRAIDHASFTLFVGKTLAIVGESGCGKSMLCRAILGLLPKAAVIDANSKIFFNGDKNLVDLREKEFSGIRGKKIAMIFQDQMTSLNPVMKIGKQITETLTYHLKMKKKAARLRAQDLLNHVGISHPKQRADQYPHQLSGGMRQRVAIAIALACRPKLLIADEPTTALDVTVQAEILDLLAKLGKEHDMSMVLVTHDLGIAANRSHDIAVMYAGRIVEKAPAKELIDNMQMPYTRALIDSIPLLKNPSHTKLKSIDGRPPDLVNLPLGCAFAKRCFKAKVRCHSNRPPMKWNQTRDHFFACWYPVENPGGGTGTIIGGSSDGGFGD